jgi:hypothetical protein
MRHVPAVTEPEPAMADLIHLAAGVAVFAAFAGYAILLRKA